MIKTDENQETREMRNAENIEQLIDETLSRDSVRKEDVRAIADRLEPEDRLDYLNAFFSFHGMKLRYADRFDSGVPLRINRLIKKTGLELKKLREQRYTDTLTGVGNRASLERQNAKRDPKQRYAVLMMDLDHFKGFNDKYGHHVGDAVLRVLGSILRDSVRKTEGRIARYGGEEFYVELNQTDARNAGEVVAERIRANVERYGMKRIGEELSRQGFSDVYDRMIKDGRTLTISIGVADEAQGREPELARHNADKALYHAKEQGRNRVVVYQ